MKLHQSYLIQIPSFSENDVLMQRYSSADCQQTVM
jgi:hypothetical protein